MMQMHSHTHAPFQLHGNKLASLPDSFADLTALTILDLSHNVLTVLPANLFALPNLTTLDLSHNALTSLPFRAPFDSEGSNTLSRTRDTRGDWFSTSITRAAAPLPRLTTLDVSHNALSASSFQHSGLPSQITKLDLSENPLGAAIELLQALARLEHLRELRMERAEIGRDSFPTDLLSALSPAAAFPALKTLDLGETQVSRSAVEAALRKPGMRQELDFEITNEEPPEGSLRVVIGKKIIKEAWEIEAERRAKAKLSRSVGAAAVDNLGGSNSRNGATPQKQNVAKETWEVDVEQGLLTEGAKRRARAAAAAQAAAAPPPTSAPTSPRKKPAVDKERWEIEAEQGLLTEGAKRRARAAAVAATSATPGESSRLQAASPAVSDTRSSPSPSPSVASALSSPKFYDASTHTLTLPPSTPPSKSSHARSISLAVSSWNQPTRGGASSGSDLTLAIPTPALPLAAIAVQPLAQTLRVLTLVNRRKDPTFSLPADVNGAFLPCLEELSLEGCNLPDAVPISHGENGDEFGSPRRAEPLLSLLARLFPSVRTLDLSYNTLTSAALTRDSLSFLILASPPEDVASTRRGLRHLRMRGNKLTELEGFQGLAEMFKGNRTVPQWRLEELDLRDNEIGKLPPQMGLLPLDVFLVEGNVYVVRIALLSVALN